MRPWRLVWKEAWSLWWLWMFMGVFILGLFESNEPVLERVAYSAGKLLGDGPFYIAGYFLGNWLRGPALGITLGFTVTESAHFVLSRVVAKRPIDPWTIAMAVIVSTILGAVVAGAAIVLNRLVERIRQKGPRS